MQLGIYSPNIVNVTHSLGDVDSATVQFKDATELINQLQELDSYIYTFEYKQTDGQTITQILFNKDNYYYVAQFETNSDKATISSLYANGHSQICILFSTVQSILIFA